MPINSREGLVPKAVIAALVGSVTGGAAGVWSLRYPAASVNAAAPAVSAASPVAAPSTSLPKPIAIAPTPTPTPQPARVPASVAPPSATPAANIDANVLQRARTLASRPDVPGLMALREDVVRRATERGVAGSPSVKGELDELDARLNEARMLQLKRDAEEFRKADSKR